MRFALVVFVDPLLHLRGAQLPLGLDDGALAVQPLGLDRVPPRCLDRQPAHTELAPPLTLHLPVAGRSSCGVSQLRRLQRTVDCFW